MDEAQDSVELLPPGWLARLEGHDFAKREAARLFQCGITRVIAHEGEQAVLDRAVLIAP